MNDPHHSAEDLLRELFPETFEALFGQPAPGGPLTLGLYLVADGRLALVHGRQLAEFTPLPPRATRRCTVTCAIMGAHAAKPRFSGRWWPSAAPATSRFA
ncbi:hypothetical protein ACFP81_03400 [Deinococcus lacus]|uniref:Uncharacterized protein n=1 Tax=Deinococcus lacus TaxID=392561 RepID=A0ABW1YD49_9DEIO